MKTQTMSEKSRIETVRFRSIAGRMAKIVMLIAVLLQWTLPSVYGNGNEKLAVTLPALSGPYETAVASMGNFTPRGEASSLVKIPEGAKIIAGYLYLSGHSDIPVSMLGNIDAVFSNSDSNTINITAELIGYSTESKNQYFCYRADVTPAIADGDHTYRLQSYQLPAQPTRGKLHGGGLLVIYSLPSFPEVNVWIADGADYFNAKDSQPTSQTVVFPFDDEGVDRYATVRLFAGADVQNAASAVWYKSNGGPMPTGDIMDTADAVDYNHSSSSDASLDTDPLTRKAGPGARWSQVEFTVPVSAEDSWIAFELESQTDFADRTPYSGLWNMVTVKVPLEATGCGSIGDQVFYDKNSDGVKGGFGERGVPTVKVNLYADNGNGVFNASEDALLDTTTTNRLGYYQFLNLEFGTYFVDIDHPYLTGDSAQVTTKNDPTAAIVLADCTPRMDIDFGVVAIGRPSKSTQITNFGATRNQKGVTLNWSAQPGTENLGYDLYRSQSVNGNYERINEEVIPTLQTNSAQHNYSYDDNSVEANTDYYYQLASVDLEGNATISGTTSTAEPSDVETDASVLPGRFELGAAYPNPFNPSTLISFRMQQTGPVTLAVFNILGQKVRTLFSGVMAAGTHQVVWNGTDDRGVELPGGLYFYQMTTKDFQSSKRVLYLK